MFKRGSLTAPSFSHVKIFWRLKMSNEFKIVKENKPLQPKQQKQFDILSERFNISEKEFKSFYNNVRKANAKASKFDKSTTLYIPQYSLKIAHIKTREDFERISTSLEEVLEPDYRALKNESVREQTYDNLEQIFGGAGKNINERLKNLTDKQFLQVMNTTALKGLMYIPYPEKLSELLDLLDVDSDFINALIDEL